VYLVDFETFLRRVGRNVPIARHLKGMSLEPATSGRGAYRYLREVEQGRRNPSLQTLFVLARRFGVTVADLVDVPGARSSEARLADPKADPPKRGRKAKPTRAAGK
jgi:transcriptional regulator with XRE-family HTH domain